MDVQFHKRMYPCLQRVKREIQTQEQTQEVRLSDDMPDVGRVLGAWGQVLIRSKEWHSSGMNVSGGVMTWVLYVPEDSSELLSLETWIPFQMKWDFPDTQRDGTIRTMCLLRSVDARSISARKLMVRVGVSCLGEALLPGDITLYDAIEVPEDVQLLKNTYPVRLPKEAGEKPFLLDESITLPSANPKPDKLIYYSIQPEIQEQRVMAGRLVFRGVANVHMLYRDEGGELFSWDFEQPFSQYTELEREYEQDASAFVVPAVTSLELDIGEDGQLYLKAGLVGQYIVYERTMIELVEDAYSLKRAITLKTETVEMPMILDILQQPIRADVTTDANANRILDVAFYLDHLSTTRMDDMTSISANGQFQTLFYGTEQNLQGAVSRWEENLTLPTDQNSKIFATIQPKAMPQGNLAAGKVNLRAEVLMDAVTTVEQELPHVTGLVFGDLTEQDPTRPALILRKAGDDSLWEIAKNSGSTVEAISQANDLHEQPEREQILLIPVL